MSTQDNRSPEEIEQDLARTRVELENTVNELVNRLDPRENLRQAKGAAQASVSQFANDARGKASGLAVSTISKAADLSQAAKQKAADLSNAAKEKTTAWRQAAQEKTSELRGKVEELAGDLGLGGDRETKAYAFDWETGEFTTEDAATPNPLQAEAERLANDVKRGEPTALAVVAGLGVAALGALTLLRRR
ncbi:Protein of unknown function [Actinobaculum suis]|uniref:DUF3618 domain-containing protein n=1 Tax=Actinobaculum suis TaxID=1657 RepID=A0A1G7AAM7_9ACTO|nr:DUF3618 domain-containing protein [Actinobaculum suis]MDY5152628.1 DUF3618 domain-containing protein [Actinobaculum suis]SDE11831.1 Protein of unknown function [Actinobaculum suis]